ncbi:Penicillin-binding protein transpeptidase [Bacillus cereus m1293]|nr:Penicillin-binding protein transpeptidase [Bacillus cereus m1293]
MYTFEDTCKARKSLILPNPDTFHDFLACVPLNFIGAS